MIYLSIETLIGENFGMNFKERNINIDLTFRCSLECPKCLRQAIRKIGFKVPGIDMPLDDLYKITKYFKGVIFCGQISDPIFHPNFIEILKHCAKNNIPTIINSAASQKSIKWYKEAFDAYSKAEWLIGIDGLPKDSNKYRINQDGPKLFKVMQMGVKMGNNIRWQYIVFNYNENNIEEARQLAKDNNIKFDLIYSGRWDVKDTYKPKNPNLYLNSKQDTFAVNRAGSNEFYKGLKEIKW